jgi:hypothetical protein
LSEPLQGCSAFASHVVTVSGHGLAALLEALATQSVVRLVQPTENEALLGFRGLNATKITGAPASPE